MLPILKGKDNQLEVSLEKNQMLGLSDNYAQLDQWKSDQNK
jgi:hypothetical protein